VVTFYKPKKTNKNKHSQPSSPIDIDALDWKGQGVGRGDNLYFVSGALPNERCTIKHAKRNKSLIAGQAQNIENRSEHRVSPFCDVQIHVGAVSSSISSRKRHLLFAMMP